MKFVLPVCSLLLAIVNVASAFAIEVGDRVEFERAGQKFEGKVVAVRGNGRLFEIESTVAGQTRKIVVAERNVRPLPTESDEGWRTWSDKSGRFKIEAKMIGQTAFEVTLQKRDGKQTKVPLDKLSLADQEYVALAEVPATENPFDAGLMSGGSPATDSSQAPTSRGGLLLPNPTVFAASSGMRMQKQGPPQEFVADPSRIDLSALGTASMNIEKAEGEVSRPLLLSSSGTKLCYQVRSKRHFGRDPVELFTKIYSIDGEQRQTKLVGEIKGTSIWLCSGDPETGNVLGAVMKDSDEKSSSLCVISNIAEGSPQVLAHWRLFPDDDNAADYVRYRKILSNGIAIVLTGGQIRAYDFESRREVWSCKSNAFNEPAVTPGGRYAACMMDRAVVILDTKSGDQLGAIPTELNGPVSLGFSPSSERLAVAAGNSVFVYDVQSAELVFQHDANTGLGAMGKQVFWTSENHLLLPTGVLLDIEKDLILWKYNLQNDGIDYTDAEHHGLLAFANNDRLTIVRLPHDRGRDASENPPTDLVALRAGDSVSVTVNAGGLANQAEIRNALSSAAERAGYRTGEGSTQLTATITRGKQVTEEYRIIGMGFRTEEVTYTPVTSRIEFSQDGKTIWQRTSTTGLPFMLSGNKTLQEAARDAEKPNLQFFEKVQLPAQILKPEFQQGFGSSNVNIDGIRDL